MNPHPPPTFRNGPHRYDLRVYYEDTDAGGVVYHANYLRFAERARTEAMRDLGVAHARLIDEFGRIFVVRRVKLDYLRPARLDDELVILTSLVASGGASVTLCQRIRHSEDGPDLAVLDIQLACIGMNDSRPARIPPEWRQAMGLMDGG